MLTRRAIALILIGAASTLVIPAVAEVSWSDSATFTLDMFCQDPSSTGLVWDDSLAFTLDMLCQDPSGTGMTFGDTGVFALQLPEVGDLNCDCAVDNFDIDSFVMALTSASHQPPFDDYYALYPDCNGMLADCNGDGSVNNFDIDYFVDLLT